MLAHSVAATNTTKLVFCLLLLWFVLVWLLETGFLGMALAVLELPG